MDPLHLYYRFRTDFFLIGCDRSGSPIADSADAPAGTKFTIVGHDKDDKNYVIRIWDFKQGSIPFGGGKKDERQALATKLNRKDMVRKVGTKETTVKNAQLYFLLSKQDLTDFTEPLSAAITPVLGAAAMPFKWRPQTGDFRDGLSVSAMGGWNFHFDRNKDHSLGILIGIGMASVTYDSLNTTLPKPSDPPVEAAKLSAISISIGALYQWQKLQIMLMGGVDHLQSAQRQYWDYEGRPWIGIGIGAAIFGDKDDVLKEGTQGAP